MKRRIFKFGTFSDDTIIIWILVTSFLLLFSHMYLRPFAVYAKTISDPYPYVVVLSKMYGFYAMYLEPIVLFIWVKFICEFLYKCLKK